MRRIRRRSVLPSTALGGLLSLLSLQLLLRLLLQEPWGSEVGGVWAVNPLVLVEGTGHPTDLLSPSLSRAGIPEDSKVEGPAFTDAIRMYRQCKELYGTWEMLCGNEVQVRPGRLAGGLRKSARGPQAGLWSAGCSFGRVVAEADPAGGAAWYFVQSLTEHRPWARCWGAL